MPEVCEGIKCVVVGEVSSARNGQNESRATATEVSRSGSLFGYFACFKSRTTVTVSKHSEKRRLKEASTGKYCWPRNDVLYLDTFNEPKDWTFTPNDSSGSVGNFQDPTTLKYIRARPRKNSIRMKDTSSPTSGSYIFELKLNNATNHVTVKHVKSSKYFGQDDNERIILVDDITQAVSFQHQ